MLSNSTTATASLAPTLGSSCRESCTDLGVRLPRIFRRFSMPARAPSPEASFRSAHSKPFRCQCACSNHHRAGLGHGGATSGALQVEILGGGAPRKRNAEVRPWDGRPASAWGGPRGSGGVRVLCWQSVLLLAASGWVHGSTSYADQKFACACASGNSSRSVAM